MRGICVAVRCTAATGFLVSRKHKHQGLHPDYNVRRDCSQLCRRSTRSWNCIVYHKRRHISWELRHSIRHVRTYSSLLRHMWASTPVCNQALGDQLWLCLHAYMWHGYTKDLALQSCAPLGATYRVKATYCRMQQGTANLTQSRFSFR